MNKIKKLNQQEINSISGGGALSTMCQITGMAAGDALGTLIEPQEKALAIIAFTLVGSKIGREAGYCAKKTVSAIQKIDLESQTKGLLKSDFFKNSKNINS